MSTSRRHDVRLPLALATQVEAFAQTHGLGLGSAIRLLTAKGLELEKAGPPGDRGAHPEPSAALAALVAFRACCLDGGYDPAGGRTADAIARRACRQAAEARLAMFSEQPTGPDQ